MQGSVDTILTALPVDTVPITRLSVLDHSTDDQILLEWLRLDSMEAFDIIYNRYWKALYNLTFNLFRERAICEDIVQDVFFQLWAKREKLQIELLQAYLFTSARHAVYKAVKSKKAVVDIDAVKEFLAAQGNTDHAILEQDVAQRAAAAISELPQKCREIFLLSREHALPVREIARQLELSPKTVENQITIALKRLRTSFSDYFILLIISTFSHIC